MVGKGVEVGLGLHPAWRVFRFRMVVYVTLRAVKMLVLGQPDYRLGVEAVAQFQPAVSGFLDEPVEEGKGMLIQCRLIRVLLRFIVSGTLISFFERVGFVRRILLNVQRHEQLGDHGQSASRTANYISRK